MKNILIIFGLLVNSLYGQMSWKNADSIMLKVHPELKNRIFGGLDQINKAFSNIKYED